MKTNKTKSELLKEAAKVIASVGVSFSKELKTRKYSYAISKIVAQLNLLIKDLKLEEEKSSSKDEEKYKGKMKPFQPFKSM